VIVAAIVAALLGLALGAGVVWWWTGLRRGDPEAAARRSHVLHELAEDVPHWSAAEILAATEGES